MGKTRVNAKSFDMMIRRVHYTNAKLLHSIVTIITIRILLPLKLILLHYSSIYYHYL